MTLYSNAVRGGDIHIHHDILSLSPTALSRVRDRKPGTEPQQDLVDTKGSGDCLMCRPDRKRERNPGGSAHQDTKEPCKQYVGRFLNDFPYLPYEHQLYFLRCADEAKLERCCHRHLMCDFGRCELYWLLYACWLDARDYRNPGYALEIHRFIAGFNIGSLAGQSQPHFHLQSGWEVVLDSGGREFKSTQLSLYFEELREEDLLIHEHGRYKLFAPWTPMGKYALDLYFFDDKGECLYEFTDLREEDFRAIAVVGESLVKRYYYQHNVSNLNIVVSCSPQGFKTEPLRIHFVPRANVAAMYELRGVNVVDTFPSTIAVEFRRVSTAKAIAAAAARDLAEWNTRTRNREPAHKPTGTGLIPDWNTVFKVDVPSFRPNDEFDGRPPASLPRGVPPPIRPSRTSRRRP